MHVTAAVFLLMCAPQQDPTRTDLGFCDYQSSNGVWNRFGGKLDWGPNAIVGDDPNFQGQGNPKSGNVEMPSRSMLYLDCKFLAAAAN